MLKINIMLESLANSQEAFTAISYANTVNGNKKYSVNLFTELVAMPIIKPDCAIFPLEKALYVDGVTIATSISTGRFLPKCVADKKVLYLWEPEWIYSNLEYLDVYRTINNAQTVIAQSDAHADCIRNISGRKVDWVIPNFDLMEILNVL